MKNFSFYSKLKGHDDAVWAITQIQDKILSGSFDGTVKMWDPFADKKDYCLKTFEVKSNTKDKI